MRKVVIAEDMAAELSVGPGRGVAPADRAAPPDPDPDDDDGWGP